MKSALSAKEPHEDQRRAHPYLDPSLAEKFPEVYRSFYRFYLSIRENNGSYEAHLNRMINPPNMARKLESNRISVAYYLNEASRYIDALLGLLPRRQRSSLRPGQTVTDSHDLRELLGIVFDCGDRRSAFEAQRKIYLARLFFDVAHTWQVQQGEVHRAFFADLIEREIYRYTVDQHEVDIAFNIASDGLEIDYHIGTALPNQEVWRFRRKELNFMQDGRPVRVRVYFYSCRSKREVLPYRYIHGQRIYRLQTREKWSDLSMRRDAAIISKMLRKGINSPREIPDIVGAMFIVGDMLEVEVLKETLFDIIGGPMKIRNVVDTLTRSDDSNYLNRYSGAGYKVYKGELDMLYRPPGGDVPPYNFVVELQLYTLEGYLRTIHTHHYANHQNLKRRQFLEGLAPLLFPEEIYGAQAGTKPAR